MDFVLSWSVCLGDKKHQYLLIHFEEDQQWIKRCEIKSNGYGMGNQTLNSSGTVLEQKEEYSTVLEKKTRIFDQNFTCLVDCQ
jgi:hypothetical protein